MHWELKLVGQSSKLLVAAKAAEMVGGKDL
jgi:hypothetical protein